MNLESVEEETVPGTQEVCQICGSGEYYAEGGFFYCSVCNTQSQSARLYVEEHFTPADAAQHQQHTRAAVLREGKGRKKRDRRVQSLAAPISSWEVYNIVLKIMADRLVEIGFPEIVKDKIFNLYVGFMMKRRVIFLSKINAKSTVTYGEPKTNLLTFYGIKMKNLGRKRKPPAISKLNLANAEEQDENDPDKLLSNARRKKKLTMNKRKAIEKEYLTQEKGDDADAAFEELLRKRLSQSQEPTNDGSNPESTTQKPGRVFSYSTAARQLRRCGLFRAKPNSLRSAIFTGNSRRRKLAAANLTKFTKFELFAYRSSLILVFVALRQLGFPVVMSDILSLYYAGILHITSYEITNFARKHEEYKYLMKLNTAVGMHGECFSLTTVTEPLDEFIKYLEIKNFMYPELKEIVPKYIDEFVLPRELECLINLINHTISYGDIVSDLQESIGIKGHTLEFRYKTIPEVFALAQIIVIMKMLFGLDDITEKYQSKFARLVNSLMEEEFGESEPWTELFVIQDWFAYLLRRRELVKKEMSSSLMYNSNQEMSMAKINEFFEKNSNVFDTKDNIYNTKKDMVPKGQATASAIELLKKLAISDSSEVPKLKQYVPLPLPTQSIVEQYIDRHPAVADSSFNLELLKTDFVNKRIDFLWNPKKYACVLESHGYKLNVIKGDAVNTFSKTEKKETENSNVIVVFQPYKNFDDFIGSLRSECSHSIKLLLNLCEGITFDFTAEHVKTKHGSCTFLQKLVNNLGDLYIKLIKAEQIPVLVMWDDLESDSE